MAIVYYDGSGHYILHDYKDSRGYGFECCSFRYEADDLVNRITYSVPDGWNRIGDEYVTEVIFAERFEQDKTVYLRFKDDPRSESMSPLDNTAVIPFAVSLLKLGLSGGRNLVMDGPIEEVDIHRLL